MISPLRSAVLVVLVVVAAAVLLAISWTPWQEPGLERVTLASSRAVPEPVGLAALQAEFNRLVEAVVPSVVSVTTTTRTAQPALPPPLDRYFGRPEPRDRTGLGSGVIVSEQGHIVTNHHVIANVDTIEVALHDGRTVAARAIASDESADLAVLRIEETGIRPVPLGDSDAVRVGDLVLAVGNPFGLDATVTNGIISATGRRLMQDAWVDFLQTNAEINPGNSGGPLVNIRGEVIGINTAIAAGRTGGWQGVGFAVPASAVRLGLDSLQRHGRIVRPHLGVVVQAVTAELARELRLDVTEGVLVREVAARGPADRAGIRRGDVIVSLAGAPVADAGDLRRQIRQIEIGTTVPVEIVRAGERQTVRATLAEAPPG
jgi:serine protease Do